MTLNDRLPDLVGKTLDHSTSRMPGEVQMYKMYVENAKEAILSDLLKIIGEDKKPFNTNFNRGIKPDIITKIENQLRQELREKVRKYCE